MTQTFQHVEINLRRVVHDVAIVFAAENKASATHIGSQLIYLVEAAIYRALTNRHLAQVANNKVIHGTASVARQFEVNAAHPKPFIFQSLNQMAANKSTGAQN